MKISKTILAFLAVGALASPGADAATLVVLNKADLVPGALPDRALGLSAIPVSCVTGAGIAVLIARIVGIYSRRASDE